jgi:hypothetical protein
MARDLIRLRVRKGSDLASAAEAVSADKAPRVLEQDGQAVAALVSIEDLNRLLLEGPPPAGIARALAAAGAWSDVNGDQLIERIYKARHESPPSQPVHL